MLCGETMPVPYRYLKVHKKLRRVNQTFDRPVLCEANFLIVQMDVAQRCPTWFTCDVWMTIRQQQNTLLYSFTALPYGSFSSSARQEPFQTLVHIHIS